ncbi:heme lyase CcmF/NrfE family subunit [Parvularcula sp. LCG005]|uniref:heme lyase CcmF/NrfE family subunit n=1 Tax=Parvularcula sp. LCG005 TaxID=3078805 RepID=UPI002943DFE3|nr:heme lyase CcmF/NrfE family subunit [Parvularcula sp. LCG005]WOI53072.1 heme lyase CcmF/NrfE family subunit [Parvularcula sp. LCG005]
MIIELGHFALILALLVAAIQTGAGLAGGHWRDRAAMRLAEVASHCQIVLVALAFAALIHAYLTSDFSVANVYDNSHSAKPVLYKLAGAWGNHEGSLLLWITILAGLGSAVAGFGRRLPVTLRARVLGVQGVIGLIFIAFALFTSNAFLRLDPVPLDGTDLNPLLQDPGLAFHPPFLYLGYVGFSVAFSFAIAALLEGRIDPAWARWVRPWTLLAWSSLTLGIAMGAWWAYYELGWGGFWFWDPVENASLMPWLAGTALLHSAIVVEKRDTLKLWTVLMAIVAFSASLLGTFVVRSGVLTSVHAFATDPARGSVLLVICAVLTGGALVLFALRGSAMRSGGQFASVSRESALILNNVILCVLTFTVMLGTFWPLFIEVSTRERMTVGPPYYTIVTTPLMILLAIIMAAGIFLPWKRGRLAAAASRMKLALGATGLALIISLYLSGLKSILAILGLMIAVWILAVTLTDIAERMKLFRLPLKTSLARAGGFPRAYWGGSLAHFGVGVAVLGMVGTTLWLTEHQSVMRPGDTAEIAGMTVRYERIEMARVANYETEMSIFSLEKDGRRIATMTPERRYYPVAEQETVEAAIVPNWADDIYIAVGDARGEDGGARVVRLYHHPLVLFLWGGGLMLVLGGGLSLSDRRYRIGAPRRKSQPMIEGVPAE